MKKLEFSIIVKEKISQTIAGYLSEKTGLPKMRVKDAMNKGAVLLRTGKHARRIRKATAHIRQGSQIELYYDEQLLAIHPPEPLLISDIKDYSVWFKPAGLMSQGTQWGDHCSLLRQVEIYYRSGRQVFPVHRLDREVEGLAIVGHTKEAAAVFSGLFRDQKIRKKYSAEVRGDLRRYAENGTIDFPLDGKPAVTIFEDISYNPEKDSSRVTITLLSGRLHQIRRHFDMIGFPVMGDPKYGKGNKNTEGMKLSAISLQFKCPFTDKEVFFSIPEPL